MFNIIDCQNVAQFYLYEINTQNLLDSLLCVMHQKEDFLSRGWGVGRASKLSKLPHPCQVSVNPNTKCYPCAFVSFVLISDSSHILKINSFDRKQV